MAPLPCEKRLGPASASLIVRPAIIVLALAIAVIAVPD